MQLTKGLYKRYIQHGPLYYYYCTVSGSLKTCRKHHLVALNDFIEAENLEKDLFSRAIGEVAWSPMREDPPLVGVKRELRPALLQGGGAFLA